MTATFVLVTHEIMLAKPGGSIYDKRWALAMTRTARLLRGMPPRDGQEVFNARSYTQSQSW